MNEDFRNNRKQAIDDGKLLDVTTWAGEAGLKYPTAVSVAVWDRYISTQDGFEQAILHSIVQSLLARSMWLEPLPFTVFRLGGERDIDIFRLKAVCGPGDGGEPVITIMVPSED